jgi:hypothetical protein
MRTRLGRIKKGRRYKEWQLGLKRKQYDTNSAYPETLRILKVTSDYSKKYFATKKNKEIFPIT